jgi:hypothetical protein
MVFLLACTVVFFFLLADHVVINWSVRTVAFCVNISKKTHILQSMHGAVDLLLKDIHQAQAGASMWVQTNNRSFIIPIADHAVGWLSEDTTLMRISGKYDISSNTWSEVQKSVVMSHVEKFSYTLDVRDKLVQVCRFSLQAYNTVVSGIAVPGAW